MSPASGAVTVRCTAGQAKALNRALAYVLRAEEIVDDVGVDREVLERAHRAVQNGMRASGLEP